MPTPKPRSGETQQEFVSRCIEFESNNSDRPQDQIQAMCFDIWRRRNEGLPIMKPESGKARLNEQVSFLQAQFEEGDGGRMIRNVVFLGPNSAHGYTYKQEAMKNAVGLYKGVRCFINHPSAEEEKTGRRNLMELAGITGDDARHEDGKIKGSIKLLDDQWGQKFWNIAHTMPQAASCSHVADGKLVTEGGKRYVEEISEVLSVDLVVQGATTSNVFESHQRKGNQMEYSDIQIEELKTKRPDIVQKLLAEGSAKRDDEVKKLMDEKDDLKNKVDEFTVKEARAKKEATVEKLLSESKLPKEAKTDVFREQLMKVEGDDFEKSAKALIEDRMSLVSGGVRNMPSQGSDETKGTNKLSEDIQVSLAELEIEE